MWTVWQGGQVGRGNIGVHSRKESRSFAMNVVTPLQKAGEQGWIVCIMSSGLDMTRIGSSELSGDGSLRYPFNGSIDEVMIFDRALSIKEVQAMYQNFLQYKP